LEKELQDDLKALEQGNLKIEGNDDAQVE
jgi:hypothetical protein